MNLADRIRQYVLDNYIEPARGVGLATVTVRAGNVHNAMNLVKRVPAVCDALDTNIFLNMANVTVVNRLGPRQGPNAHWVFSL